MENTNCILHRINILIIRIIFVLVSILYIPQDLYDLTNMDWFGPVFLKWYDRRSTFRTEMGRCKHIGEMYPHLKVNRIVCITSYHYYNYFDEFNSC